MRCNKAKKTNKLITHDVNEKRDMRNKKERPSLSDASLYLSPSLASEWSLIFFLSFAKWVFFLLCFFASLHSRVQSISSLIFLIFYFFILRTRLLPAFLHCFLSLSQSTYFSVSAYFYFTFRITSIVRRKLRGGSFELFDNRKIKCFRDNSPKSG